MKHLWFFTLVFTLLTASLHAGGQKEPFQETVERMDLDKFLGSWYVIALMPTAFEKNAVNGIETYTRNEQGEIGVEYVFYDGDPQGKKKTMVQKVKIIDPETNTEWKVQPFWPLWLPYLILELAEDYRYTVVGTDNYKYVWIMAREPMLSEEDYMYILNRLEKRGYKLEDLIIMPQIW